MALEEYVRGVQLLETKRKAAPQERPDRDGAPRIGRSGPALIKPKVQTPFDSLVAVKKNSRFLVGSGGSVDLAADDIAYCEMGGSFGKVRLDCSAALGIEDGAIYTTRLYVYLSGPSMIYAEEPYIEKVWMNVPPPPPARDDGTYWQYVDVPYIRYRQVYYGLGLEIAAGTGLAIDSVGEALRVATGMVGALGTIRYGAPFITNKKSSDPPPSPLTTSRELVFDVLFLKRPGQEHGSWRLTQIA